MEEEEAAVLNLTNFKDLSNSKAVCIKSHDSGDRVDMGGRLSTVPTFSYFSYFFVLILLFPTFSSNPPTTVFLLFHKKVMKKVYVLLIK